MWAANNGHAELVKHLIGAGAHLYAKNKVSAGAVMGGGVSGSSG